MTDQPPPPDRGSADIRPVVGSVRRTRGPWLFGVAMVILAGLLFYALESRRSNLETPALGEDAVASGERLAPLPPLAVPDLDRPAYDDALLPLRQPAPADYGHEDALARPFARERPRFEAEPVGTAASPPEQEPQGRAFGPPADLSAPGPLRDPFGGDAAPGRADERARASRLANPSTTVPKGTIIQAVLETALDSTRPGFTRAIVSRDIFGFDGTQVLIPRGSRLIGEYKADLQPGQKRALIQWQRLMRPDGVIINLDSPAADPLGRSGIEGKVNSHFFQRFGGGILQSALTAGAQIAVNQASNGNTIYAVPLTGAVGNSITQDRVQPTVKVRQGTSLSVFVARDLDFTTISP